MSSGPLFERGLGLQASQVSISKLATSQLAIELHSQLRTQLDCVHRPDTAVPGLSAVPGPHCAPAGPQLTEAACPSADGTGKDTAERRRLHGQVHACSSHTDTRNSAELSRATLGRE